MPEPLDPELLDVVPWSYGFAHSWALKWLTEHEPTRDRLLSALVPEGSAPWTLARGVAREHRIGTARTDLAVWATDRDGGEHALAVEIKVADPIKPWQIKAYEEAGFSVVLYVPGLTGLLYEPNGPVAGERWMTGRDVAESLRGASLPPIIASYITAVEAEADRMAVSRAFSRGEVDDFPHDGQALYEDLMDAGWIVEVVAAMRASGAQDIEVRPQANDRGLFWAGSWHELQDGRGAGLYIDIVADLRSHLCAVAIKVGGGEAEDRRSGYDTAVAAGAPSDGPWRLGRRPSRASGRVWTLDASEMDAAETARHAKAAFQFIKRLVDQE